MNAVTLPKLMTPEQVSEELGMQPNGRPALSAYEIRRMARSGQVVHQRGPRQRILFTPDQAQALVDSMTFQPDPDAARALAADPDKVAMFGVRTSKRSRGPRRS